MTSRGYLSYTSVRPKDKVAEEARRVSVEQHGWHAPLNRRYQALGAPHLDLGRKPDWGEWAVRKANPNPNLNPKPKPKPKPEPKPKPKPKPKPSPNQVLCTRALRDAYATQGSNSRLADRTHSATHMLESFLEQGVGETDGRNPNPNPNPNPNQGVGEADGRVPGHARLVL